MLTKQRIYYICLNYCPSTLIRLNKNSLLVSITKYVLYPKGGNSTWKKSSLWAMDPFLSGIFLVSSETGTSWAVTFAPFGSTTLYMLASTGILT